LRQVNEDERQGWGAGDAGKKMRGRVVWKGIQLK